MKSRGIVIFSLFLLLMAGVSIYLWRASENAKFEAASPAERGWMLVDDRGCRSCHQADNGFRAPTLEGLYGREVTLSDGSKVIADEAYIRESLLDPKAKISAGYQAVMPSFDGVLSDQEISEIIEAMKAKTKGADAKPQE